MVLSSRKSRKSRNDEQAAQAVIARSARRGVGATTEAAFVSNADAARHQMVTWAAPGLTAGARVHVRRDMCASRRWARQPSRLMNMRYVLALDQGTTSSRAIIFD